MANMLKGLAPVLGADLLYALAAMGHGDEIALVDRNFPAASTAHRLIVLAGVDVVGAARAVLTLLPLDTFVASPLVRMEVDGAPEQVPDVQTEVRRACEGAERRPIAMGSLSRHEFYARAREAFAVVATTEARPYGCFLLIKGVIHD